MNHGKVMGAKRWIGNGTIADLVLVWARDEDSHGDVSGFVIDRTKDNPAGYHASVITGKISNRALGTPAQGETLERKRRPSRRYTRS